MEIENTNSQQQNPDINEHLWNMQMPRVQFCILAVSNTINKLTESPSPITEAAACGGSKRFPAVKNASNKSQSQLDVKYQLQYWNPSIIDDYGKDAMLFKCKLNIEKNCLRL